MTCRLTPGLSKAWLICKSDSTWPHIHIYWQPDFLVSLYQVLTHNTRIHTPLGSHTNKSYNVHSVVSVKQNCVSVTIRSFSEMIMSILHTSIKLSKHYARLKFSVSCVINSLPHSGTITHTFIFIFLFFHSQVCIISTKDKQMKRKTHIPNMTLKLTWKETHIMLEP